MLACIFGCYSRFLSMILPFQLKGAMHSRHATIFAFCVLMLDFPDQVSARNMATFDVGGPEPMADDRSINPTTAHAEQTASAEAAVSQDSGKRFAWLMSGLQSFKFSSIWEKLTGLPNNESTIAPGPTWIAIIALAGSLCFCAHWMYQRGRGSKFDTQPEITLQRKLFDEASRGKLPKHAMLREFVRIAGKWLGALTAVAGIAFLVLTYVDTSYIVLGCFGFVAVVHDRQYEMTQGETKLVGIDLA